MSPTTFLIRIGILSLFLILIDLYTFNGLKSVTNSIETPFIRQAIHIVFWTITILYFSAIVFGVLNFNPMNGPRGINFKIITIGLVLLWLPKIVFCLFLIGEDIFRIFNALFVFTFDKFGWEAKGNANYFPERRKIVSQIGLAIASIPFASVLYGVTKGKYNFVIREVELTFKELPWSFDGLTITQISDVHSGSFDDAAEVKRGVELINAQKSDIVVFTGDLVNNIASEFHPWIDIFKTIEAPLGKYSITGNHDYGEYVPWPSEEARNKNFEALLDNHSKIGFKILMNENVVFTRNSEQLALVGIENWGLPPFPQKGDINKAINGLEKETFKVLLSHDPSHWDAQVLVHPSNFHLTLSGHTHGMQFGIEIPGFFKWSPVKFKYPRWAGLYKEKGTFLYVNRGFGFIGFPGRVGIWPEITKITLRSAMA
ncbi:MAG: metallophosphoesterase [Bacteroidota bacterium]|nr:metallophosphoesterase [Bacteroidota bacterium]